MNTSYTNFYDKIAAPWRQMPNGSKRLVRLDSFLRLAMAAAYLGLLAWLAATGSTLLLRAVAVPLATFGIVSVLRIQIGSYRPYEAYPISPLIPKDTQGRSMPSRHVASATVIACTLLWAAGPVWGIAGFAACAAIGYTRVAGGVHFPRDVVVAAALASLCALIGFVLLP